MYQCNQCNKMKTEEEYYKARGKPLPKCKECCKLNAKEKYENNKDQISLRIRNYKKIQKENNSEVYKKCLLSNKTRQAIYQKTDKGKLVNKICQHKRRELVKSNNSDVTTEKLKGLLLSQQNKCFYCSKILNLEEYRAVHLDHVIPLSKGGLHRMDNVVWACSTCNQSKSNKLDFSKELQN